MVRGQVRRGQVNRALKAKLISLEFILGVIGSH